MRKHGRLTAAALTLAALAAVKTLRPEVGAQAREQFTDFVEQRLETAVSLSARNTEQGEAEAPTPTPTPTPRPVLVVVTGSEPEEGSVPAFVPEPSPTPEPTPEPTEPPVVAVFLENQLPFAEYGLPETVDYAYTPLPFDFAVPVSGYRSSGFGYRLHPILHTVRFHYGTDLAANAGEAVLAFTAGTVDYAGYDDSFGWHLSIDHGDGWKTLYAHCSRLDVTEGQQVERGQQIALVGSTGLATGPHLHFELTRDGIYLNPEYYINS